MIDLVVRISLKSAMEEMYGRCIIIAYGLNVLENIFFLLGYARD